MYLLSSCILPRNVSSNSRSCNAGVNPPLTLDIRDAVRRENAKGRTAWSRNKETAGALPSLPRSASARLSRAHPGSYQGAHRDVLLRGIVPALPRAYAVETRRRRSQVTALKPARCVREYEMQALDALHDARLSGVVQAMTMLSRGGRCSAGDAHARREQRRLGLKRRPLQGEQARGARLA